MDFTIDIVPCLYDNYAYLLGCSQTNALAVVDPGEAAPVIDAVGARGGRLEAILNTHHHLDHTGGSAGLVRRFQGVRVYAHVRDRTRIDRVDTWLDGGDTVRTGNLHIAVLHVPGHTLGAVAYHVGDALFTGDTLFGAGCGRLFEGTPEMMYRSLVERIGRMSSDTRVYFGHEYTVANLRFALDLEAGNPALLDRLENAVAAIDAGRPTSPSTIELELATNPFMRCRSKVFRDTLRERLGIDADDAAGAFRAIRALKDAF